MKNKYLHLLFYLIFFFSFSLYSQQTTVTDTIDVDKVFEQARQLAFTGKKAEARGLCRLILKKSPDYADVRVLLARTYSWDGIYDSARVELKDLIQRKFYADAILALIDVEIWDDKPDSALFYCDLGLLYEPNNEEILIKKAKILIKKEQENEAKTILRQVLDNVNPASTEAEKLLFDIKTAKLLNRIDLGWANEYFDETNLFKANYLRNWNVYTLGYSHRFKKIGLVQFRGNLGTMNEDPQINKQFEINAYPSISKNNYLYLGYGYSPEDNHFPRHYFGAELYQKLPKAFEASLGFRLLKFYGSEGVSNTLIFTGSIGKYIGNYWFSLRPYITPDANKLSEYKLNRISTSLYFTVRRYFATSDDYLSLTVGGGVSPTKYTYFENLQHNRRMAVTLGYSHIFNKRYYITTSIGIYREQATPGKTDYRNELDSSIKLGYLF
ncbi:MAG: YaiO family outer membrane beta-barrel protein [Bacteroidales bacterium]|nr:YaiO family outer membrane beta-barrel protein [Bacteroidales bacterium]